MRSGMGAGGRPFTGRCRNLAELGRPAARTWLLHRFDAGDHSEPRRLGCLSCIPQVLARGRRDRSGAGYAIDGVRQSRRRGGSGPDRYEECGVHRLGAKARLQATPDDRQRRSLQGQSKRRVRVCDVKTTPECGSGAAWPRRGPGRRPGPSSGEARHLVRNVGLLERPDVLVRELDGQRGDGVLEVVRFRGADDG